MSLKAIDGFSVSFWQAFSDFFYSKGLGNRATHAVLIGFLIALSSSFSIISYTVHILQSEYAFFDAFPTLLHWTRHALLNFVSASTFIFVLFFPQSQLGRFFRELNEGVYGALFRVSLLLLGLLLLADFTRTILVESVCIFEGDPCFSTFDYVYIFFVLLLTSLGWWAMCSLVKE